MTAWSFWGRMRKAASFARGAKPWQQAGINLNPRNFETGASMYERKDIPSLDRPGEAPAQEVKEAVVAYITRGDKILVVWNRRYLKWGLPGGRRESGEDRCATLVREMKEETNSELETVTGPIYHGPHGEKVDSTRGSYVYVYAATLKYGAYAIPRETEPGCPVTWMTRDEFLKCGLAPDFYRKMFEAVDGH